jgi:hypothetical protein
MFLAALLLASCASPASARGRAMLEMPAAGSFRLFGQSMLTAEQVGAPCLRGFFSLRLRALRKSTLAFSLLMSQATPGGDMGRVGYLPQRASAVPAAPGSGSRALSRRRQDAFARSSCLNSLCAHCTCRQATLLECGARVQLRRAGLLAIGTTPCCWRRCRLQH